MATSRFSRLSGLAPAGVLAPPGPGRHRLTDPRAGGPAAPQPRAASRPAPPPDRDQDRDQDQDSWLLRALRTLAGAFVVTWSFRLAGYLTLDPWLAIPVALLGLGGLAFVVAAWLPGRMTGRGRQLDWAMLIAAVAGLVLWSYFQVYIAPDYGTDEIAFDQYAAQLALHGLDPYLHSMAAAFPLFHVSPNGYTFLLSGRPVTSLSYPALSFEAYLPLLALGLHTQAAVWTDVAAWALGAVLLLAVLPRRLAPLAVIVVSMDVFTGYAVGGITDVLFVPLLAGAAVRWDSFGSARGPAAWRGPVLLGLAMAVKQTPWLVAPFVITGIVTESWRASGPRQAARDGLRYASIAAAAFAVPNLPYLISGPGGWLHGVLTPILAPTVPAGQGLVSLSLSLPVGGGSLTDYTAAAVVVAVSLLACYAAGYPALKPATFLLPSIVLFFASRSFGSYLVMLLPAAIAGAATTRRPPGLRAWRHWRLVALAGAACCAAVTGLALTAASPLRMTIRSVGTTGQLATVSRVRLSVTNTCDHPVRAAFTIEDGASMTAFWRRSAGPATLAPHQRASYTIEAPSYFAMPSISDGFQVLAFAQHPASVSRTGVYLASQWRVVLTPATIGGAVPARHRVTVRAQIVDRLNRRIRVAGVPVYLGQVTYAQRGLEYSQAVINNSQPGQTPVEAATNAQGVATFRLGAPAGQSAPVYFEANLVRQGQAYPYGYSPILMVRFGS